MMSIKDFYTSQVNKSNRDIYIDVNGIHHVSETWDWNTDPALRSNDPARLLIVSQITFSRR